MIRKYLQIGNKNLSYLDNEKIGQPLICLHGHFGCASMFTFLENIYNGRLVLIDQRGHGNSDKFDSYRTTDYVEDLEKVITSEKLENPIILGHSLGGVSAFSYASRFQNVKALIIEDIGTEVECSNEFIRKLPKSFNSLYDVERSLKNIDIEFDQYFIESIRYDGTHWKFQFDYDDMVTSQIEMNGVYWDKWLSLTCPILLLHGTNSWACNTKNISEMGRRNQHVTTRIYDSCGHTLHDEQRERYCNDVKEFLENICV